MHFKVVINVKSITGDILSSLQLRAASRIETKLMHLTWRSQQYTATRLIQSVLLLQNMVPVFISMLTIRINGRTDCAEQ